MIGIIMAGGKGTRLRPLTCDKPKPMVPIVNQPMMEHILQLMPAHGIRDVRVTAYYLPEVIEEYFGTGERFGVKLSYALEESPLGTAGSVRNAVAGAAETVLVISGDALTDLDLSAAVRFHREKGAAATLVLTRVTNPLPYGVVILDETGHIVRFLEKPSWSQVFSDTVNTGIYVLEPEVIDLIPPDRPYDFSKELFPLLLQKGYPLYGWVGTGYWSDIGDLEQYREAHYDCLARRAKVKLRASQLGEGIWVGKGVEIDPGARIAAPAVIGDYTRVGPGAQVGPYAVVGTGTVIGKDATLKRTILWDNVYVDQGVELRGAVIGNRCRLRKGAAVYEGAVVADDCSLGPRSTVKPGVKLWPGKTLDTGVTLDSNLVWGTRFRRFLFGAHGVVGAANTEITPEFAAKLGAAFGATMDPGSWIVISADDWRPSRMAKRSLIGGILSSGVNVFDLGTMALPVTRYAVGLAGARGGIHVQNSPYDADSLLIELLDSRGVNLSRGQEREVENHFFRGDLRRANPSEVGQLAFLPRVVERYLQELLEAFQVESIRKQGYKVVIDACAGCLSLHLPAFLKALGCQTVWEDSTPRPRTLDELLESVERLRALVQEHEADLGIAVGNSGEKLLMVDESGRLVGDELFLALISLLVLRRCRTTVVPVHASQVIEALAGEGKVIRTQADIRTLMEKALEERIFVGENGLPRFQPAFDALASLAMILEMMAKDQVPLSVLVDSIPRFYMQRQSISCPWEAKGRVMRELLADTQQLRRELVDGVKVFHEQGWALVLPDPDEPFFQVWAEADSPEEADALLRMYMGKIEACQRES